MPAEVLRPDPVTIQARVPLADSRSETGLGEALGELVAFANELPRLVGETEDDPPPFLLLTFHTNERK